MKKRARALLALLGGLGSPATVFSTPTFSRPVGSDLDRMRGDVARVGETMRLVIALQQQKPGNPTKKPPEGGLCVAGLLGKP